MRSKEEHNVLKEEVLNKVPAELTDEELGQVSGGITDKDIMSRVIGLVRESMDLNNIEIDQDSLIVGDLGADSLDVVDMVQTLEEEFKITFPDSGDYRNCTVGDICSYISKKTNPLNR